MKRHRFDPASTWKLYHESGIEIDLWKDPYTDAITSRAITVPLAGHSVRIAERHDLIAMKLRADRPQDDYDISEVIKQTPIEEERLRELVTAEQFARYEAIRARTLRS